MTDSNQVFNLFPDFIKNYIYRHRWEELREIQIAAAETILQTDHNLLLTFYFIHLYHLPLKR